MLSLSSESLTFLGPWVHWLIFDGHNTVQHFVTDGSAANRPFTNDYHELTDDVYFIRSTQTPSPMSPVRGSVASMLFVLPYYATFTSSVKATTSRYTIIWKYGYCHSGIDELKRTWSNMRKRISIQARSDLIWHVSCLDNCSYCYVFVVHLLDALYSLSLRPCPALVIWRVGLRYSQTSGRQGIIDTRAECLVG